VHSGVDRSVYHSASGSEIPIACKLKAMCGSDTSLCDATEVTRRINRTEAHEISKDKEKTGIARIIN
jgi:hypothetical protein